MIDRVKDYYEMEHGTQKERETKILNRLKNFFEMEYNDACIACGYKWTTPKEVVKGAIQRCLGVAFFVQTITDISFDEVNSLYEEYRRKLEELENV